MSHDTSDECDDCVCATMTGTNFEILSLNRSRSQTVGCGRAHAARANVSSARTTGASVCACAFWDYLVAENVLNPSPSRGTFPGDLQGILLYIDVNMIL